MFATALGFFGLISSFRHATNLTDFNPLVTAAILVKKTMYNHKNYESYTRVQFAYPQFNRGQLVMCIILPLKRDIECDSVVFFAWTVEKPRWFAYSNGKPVR